METYYIASSCICTPWGPLEFEAGHCARCGRWIFVDAYAQAVESVASARQTACAVLDAVVERKRLELLDAAEEDGIDVENDKDGYRTWLEERMAALDVEAGLILS